LKLEEESNFVYSLFPDFMCGMTRVPIFICGQEK